MEYVGARLDMHNGDATVTPQVKPDEPPTLAHRTQNETVHLREAHQLTPVVAWIRVPAGAVASGAEVRSSAATRMARSRAKKAAGGLVQCHVPAAILEEVKAAGGWDLWLQQRGTSSPVAVPLETRTCACSSSGKCAARGSAWAIRCVRWLLRRAGNN